MSMAWLGLHSYRLTDPTNEFFRSFTPYCVVFLIMVGLASSIILIIEHASDLQYMFQMFEMLAGWMQALLMFISIGINSNKVKQLHLKLQEIVDEGDTQDIYWRAEQKCRKNTLRINSLVVVHTASFMPSLLYALFCLTMGKSDASSWALVFEIVLPIDTSRIWGWFLMWSIQLCMDFSYVMTMASIVSYFVSCCFYIDALCESLELAVCSACDDFSLCQIEENIPTIEKHRSSGIEKLKRSITLHNRIYETSQMQAEIVNGVILDLLPMTVVTMASSMFIFELSASSLTYFEFVFNINAVISTLIWPSLMCVYASFATDRITSIGNKIYNSNWFEFPIEYQKYITMSIIRSQKPAYFPGFKLVRCTLETLAGMFKTSCSYYVLFRRFGKQ